MRTIQEILQDYTAGKTSAEEANAALAAADAGYRLTPGRNTLTEAEIRATTIGQYPDMANGWGLLDTGTGSFDKVEVRDGHLMNCDCGIMPAMCILAGRAYYVRGDVLTDEKPDSPAAEHLPKTPDMSRREDLAGKTVEQKTASGIFRVTYDALGYAVKSSRK